MAGRNMRVTVIANTGPVAATLAVAFKNAAGITITAAATGFEGNDFTVEFVKGLAFSVVKTGNAFLVTFVDAVTTSGDVQAAAGWGASVVVDGGNGAALVDPDDAQGPTNLAGGDSGIRQYDNPTTDGIDREVQNTSVAVVYLTGSDPTPSAATGYPLKAMSGAATFDGGVYKVKGYNGKMHFFSAAASSVRIVDAG